LRRTLRSITALVIPSSIQWELIVVNNNGTDDTDAVVASFDRELPVKLVQQPTPGLSYARNRAIEAASGDIILWTDDDVVVSPRWIERIVAGFEESNADFVFGPSKPSWEEGRAPTWFSPVHYGKFALIDYGPQPFVVKDLSTPFFGLNFAVRRELLISMGGFREDLGVKEESGGGEDMDLFRRACTAGHRIAYIPEAVVEHVIPAVRMTREFHRKKIKAGLPMYYRMLQDQYSAQPWLLGVPRFLFPKALGDAAGYARSVVLRDRPAAFHYELQLLKFVGACRQAAAKGTTRAASTSAVVPGRRV
jgi:glycosyltransferase involved in cell wall biosynthesis